MDVEGRICNSSKGVGSATFVGISAPAEQCSPTSTCRMLTGSKSTDVS